jgi:hypothetical protein
MKPRSEPTHRHGQLHAKNLYMRAGTSKRSLVFCFHDCLSFRHLHPISFPHEEGICERFFLQWTVPTQAHCSRAGRVRCLSTDRSWSVVGGDDRASLDLAVVQEPVGFAGALQRKVLDQHRDFSRLGEADHLHQLGDESPVG